MGRQVTLKTVQIHEECSCGHNTVDEQEVKIKFKDLQAAGIRYAKDSETGEWFFTKHICYQCQGHDEE